METQTKSKNKWIVLACILAVLVFSVLFFRVRLVSFEGNTYYSGDKMQEMFQTNIFERNLLSFWVMDKLGLTPELAFVREYEVSYPSYDEIHIKLYEKTIVAGIAYNNQYIYFDKDGMVLVSSNEPKSQTPLFETSICTFS